jgi:hypothetical protein
MTLELIGTLFEVGWIVVLVIALALIRSIGVKLWTHKKRGIR